MQPNWFFALPVPAHPWLAEVLRNLPSSCRPFAPDDLHMTLAFLGALPPNRVSSMVALLEKIEAPAFEISLGPILALPSPIRLSALSFSVRSGHDCAAALIAAHRDGLLAAAGAKPDGRPPLPHITVARPGRRFGQEGQAAALAWAAACEPPPTTIAITSVGLYTWSEDRQDRQFRIVAQRPLSG